MSLQWESWGGSAIRHHQVFNLPSFLKKKSSTKINARMAFESHPGNLENYGCTKLA